MTLPEATPSVVNSDVSMASSGNDFAGHLPNQLLEIIHQATAALLPAMRNDQVHNVPPIIPEQATSKPPMVEYHPRVSCDTFTAQATKFSGNELHMSAENWVKMNKHEFNAYLPGVPEQMHINAPYPLLTDDAKATVGQHLFDTMLKFYAFLCDTFPQSEYEAKVFEAIRSGKIFRNAPQHALGAYALCED
ncbi:hypothetical protein H4R24_004463, partial [Coemansia sp. RSA 988]